LPPPQRNYAAEPTIKLLTGHSSSIRHQALLSNGKLVTGSRDSTARIWDLKTGHCLQTLKERTLEFIGLAVSPTGEIVTHHFMKGTSILCVWDSETGKKMQTIQVEGPICFTILPEGNIFTVETGKIHIFEDSDSTSGASVPSFL